MHLAVLHRIFQQNLPWCNHGRTVDHIRFLQLCKCDFLRGMHDRLCQASVRRHQHTGGIAKTGSRLFQKLHLLFQFSRCKPVIRI